MENGTAGHKAEIASLKAEMETAERERKLAKSRYNQACGDITYLKNQIAYHKRMIRWAKEESARLGGK